MAQHCRTLDLTHPMTVGVNLLLNGLATVGIGAFKVGKDDPAASGWAAAAVRTAREMAEQVIKPGRIPL
jgi:hypothetical protein